MERVALHPDEYRKTKQDRDITCDFDKRILNELIKNNSFYSHFQPIVSTASQNIYAYEGLCRIRGENPFGSIDNLFERAIICNETCTLDMLCRENAIRLAAEQNIGQTDSLLFINVCPTTLQQSVHSPGETERLVKAWGLKKEKVILEITEREAVSNYPLFLRAIGHYRDRGFKIAIDDFGAGYGGLKMLSLIAPDFVKIDRHFIHDIDSAHINYSLIDAIATICHRIGIHVIAEGIETDNDLKICQNFGIELLQGYYFARPSSNLISADAIDIPSSSHKISTSNTQLDEPICIEDIVSYQEPAHVLDNVLTVHNRFSEDLKLHCLPILSGDTVCGVINRHRFMENHMVGRHGYGMNLNYYRKIDNILEKDFVQVPHHTPIEEVAKKINMRESTYMYDDICVTRSGKFIGTVAVGSILEAVTNNSIKFAKGANPLTGLPGNEFIQREIVKMLSQSIQFDVCYIDIDYFKPYNDKHGYALGDEVINAVGKIIAEAAKKFTLNGIGFAGHIGGDDFIVITRPKRSIPACEAIIEDFAKQLPRFHTQESIESGCYSSTDREGNIKVFSLLSISVGIVSTEVHHITSAAEVSSIASELKKKAKAIEGSAIIRDRRVLSWFESSNCASCNPSVRQKDFSKS